MALRTLSLWVDVSKIFLRNYYKSTKNEITGFLVRLAVMREND